MHPSINRPSQIHLRILQQAAHKIILNPKTHKAIPNLKNHKAKTSKMFFIYSTLPNLKNNKNLTTFFLKIKMLSMHLVNKQK